MFRFVVGSHEMMCSNVPVMISVRPATWALGRVSRPKFDIASEIINDQCSTLRGMILIEYILVTLTLSKDHSSIKHLKLKVAFLGRMSWSC